MKWCVAVMMLLLMSSHAGVRKQDPVPEIVAEINAFDSSRAVHLQPLIDATVGQTIGFKIGTRVVVAVVEHHDKSPQGLMCTGSFLGRNDAGFVFEFERLPDKRVHITGVLFFEDTRKYYTLESDAKGDMCFVEHDMDAPETSTLAHAP